MQGCGKSLVARSVANAWRLPLLRLDVGRLFASLVGSSEENLRNAIKVAESIAPVVLWVDEIEKGFSGVGSSNVSDAGTAVCASSAVSLPGCRRSASRSLSSLRPMMCVNCRRNWCARALRRDLLRRPADGAEHADIWRIHLIKRNRDPKQFDLTTLAMASEGLSGAEIEQAVVADLYEAFDRNRRWRWVICSTCSRRRCR